MADEGLTDIEKAWLVGLDAMLVQTTMDAHAAAAGQIVLLWGCGGPIFHIELTKRAALWCQRHAKMQRFALDANGPCEWLVQLTGLVVPRKNQTSPRRTPRPSRSQVVPSRRSGRSMRRINDEEVERFLKLLDEEGIDAVFDPGNSITSDGMLFRPPLIVIDGAGVFHDDIAPVYARGEIDRAWDPVEREPAIALAFDLALLVAAREKKWTWVICDRHFNRLPWGHPCKVTPEGRPGWKLVTGMLERAGLVGRWRGQTWRLTEAGKATPAIIQTLWVNNA